MTNFNCVLGAWLPVYSTPSLNGLCTTVLHRLLSEIMSIWPSFIRRYFLLWLIVVSFILYPFLTNAQMWGTAITAGQYHSVVLLKDSTVKAFGRNLEGQVGDSTTSNQDRPRFVNGLTEIIRISAGNKHSLALKLDGTVWAWGDNGDGQLGDGTTTQRISPVQVSGLTGVIEISGGNGYHSVALKSDGTVWAWGLNDKGQLGNGTTTDSSVPVQSTGLTGVIAISAGKYHTLALKSDSTIWSYGGNWYGMLGDGTTSQRTTPVQVVGLTGIKAIDGGAEHNLALKSDSTVWAWGRNSDGQVGDGTTTNRTSPVQVSGISSVMTVSAGGYFSAVIKTDSTLWVWGSNSYGQFGDATTTDSSTPLRETTASFTNLFAVAAGGYHNLMLKNIESINMCSTGRGWKGQLGNDATSNTSTITCAIVLPIELLNFDAEAHSYAVDLLWATATEINNDYFTIYRSKDGVKFEEVMRVRGAGYSKQVLNYKIRDKNPYSGVSYYRLKQTDFDGRFSYSDLIAVKMGAFSDISVFPNPMNGNLVNIKGTGVAGDEIVVVLYNPHGKEITSKVVLTNNNSFSASIDMSQRLSSGIYLITGTSRSGENIFRKKLCVN